MLRLLMICMFVLMPAMMSAENDSITVKKNFWKKTWDGALSVVKEFNNVDTAYIEPQHYKFTTTLMSTYFFEAYSIRSKNGQSIDFAPEARIKVGPYIGWSVLFWGYTVDLAYISANKKKELDLSVYTSMVGVDFFRRNSGSDYKIRSLDLNDDSPTDSISGVPFDGLDVSITGLNAYYIPNHRKFSYPAAFSQSTCQRRSAGSFMFGGGYTRHSLKMDSQKLKNAVERAMPGTAERLDSGLLLKDINEPNFVSYNITQIYGYLSVGRIWLQLGVFHQLAAVCLLVCRFGIQACHW